MQKMLLTFIAPLLPLGAVSLGIPQGTDPEVRVFKVEDRLFPETAYNSRNRPSNVEIDTIVYHNICMPSDNESEVHACTGPDSYRYDADSVISLLQRYPWASAHYLIDRDGNIYRLVREERKAHHAGRSYLAATGRSGYNDFSIGIELINAKNDSATEAQYIALQWLVADIRTRHEIIEVVGHGQIASDRREDPYNFDWERVADW